MKIVETYIIKCTRVTEPIEQCYDDELLKVLNDKQNTEKELKKVIEEAGFEFENGGFVSGNIKAGY